MTNKIDSLIKEAEKDLFYARKAMAGKVIQKRASNKLLMLRQLKMYIESVNPSKGRLLDLKNRLVEKSQLINSTVSSKYRNEKAVKLNLEKVGYGLLIDQISAYEFLINATEEEAVR